MTTISNFMSTARAFGASFAASLRINVVLLMSISLGLNGFMIASDVHR